MIILETFLTRYVRYPMMSATAHYGTKAELGLCREGANWAKNGATYILIFTAILSHMEHVKH